MSSIRPSNTDVWYDFASLFVCVWISDTLFSICFSSRNKAALGNSSELFRLIMLSSVVFWTARNSSNIPCKRTDSLSSVFFKFSRKLFCLSVYRFNFFKTVQEKSLTFKIKARPGSRRATQKVLLCIAAIPKGLSFSVNDDNCFPVMSRRYTILLFCHVVTMISSSSTFASVRQFWFLQTY